MRPWRVAIGLSVFVAMLAACAGVADLNVTYKPEVTSGAAFIYGATTDNITNDPSVQVARKIE